MDAPIALEKCVEYPFGFDVRFAGRTGEEWSEFGVLNAPMDRYSTVDYYFWLEHSFERSAEHM